MVSGQLVCWEVGAVWCSGGAPLTEAAPCGSTWLLVGSPRRAAVLAPVLPWGLSLGEHYFVPWVFSQLGIGSQGDRLRLEDFKAFSAANLLCSFRLYGAWFKRGFGEESPPPPPHTPGRWDDLVG